MTTKAANSDAMPSPQPAPVQDLWSSVQEPLWTYDKAGACWRYGGRTLGSLGCRDHQCINAYGTCVKLAFMFYAYSMYGYIRYDIV